MRNWQGSTVLRVAAFALLAGAAGCSDDVNRLGGGLTTASLGIEPSNQDRIIRKIGADPVKRTGVRPVDVPEQAFPTAVAEATPAPAVSYAAPTVSTNALPPLKPAAPALAASKPLSDAERSVRRVEKVAREAPEPASPVVRRKVTKPKLAAAGVPVVPPTSEAPGRLRKIGEPIHTGSIKRAARPVREAASKTAAAPVGGAGSYTVVSGDTLYGIARRNGVSVSALMGANGLAGSALRLGPAARDPRLARPRCRVTQRRPS